MSSEIDRMLSHYGGSSRSASDYADDDAHMRNVLLDEEARQNLAAQSYPAEWGRMPSDAGPLGDALDTFGRTMKGPAAPMSGMSPDARREILMHAATLLGLGHNPMTEAIGMGRANGGPVPDISNTLAQYGGTPEATGGSPFWWLNQSMLQPYNPPPLPQADASYVGNQPQIMAPPSLPPASVSAPVASPGPTGGPMQGPTSQPPVAGFAPSDPRSDIAATPASPAPPVANPIANTPQMPPAPVANPGLAQSRTPSTLMTATPELQRSDIASPPSMMSGYADGGAVDEELAQYSEPERGFDAEKFKRGIGQLAQRAWDARPWKGHAENPSSPWPALGIAAGLLHPRLGGATRDLAMARHLRGAGDLPAALPEGMPMHRRPDGIGVGPHGTFQPQSFEQLRAPANTNVRNAEHMRPGLSVVGKEPSAPAAGSPYKPGSRVAAYEAYLDGLPAGEAPVTFRTFVRDLLD